MSMRYKFVFFSTRKAGAVSRYRPCHLQRQAGGHEAYVEGSIRSDVCFWIQQSQFNREGRPLLTLVQVSSLKKKKLKYLLTSFLNGI